MNKTTITKKHRTIKHDIKPANNLYKPITQLMKDATSLYNRANYIYRQITIGLTKPKEKRTKNEQDMIALANKFIHKANIKRARKEKKALPLMTEDHRYLTYETLEMILRTSSDKAYKRLPAHVAQHVIKQLLQNWKSFYAANESYKQDPSRFSGKPKIPGYKKHGSLLAIESSNQECKIVEKNGFLLLKLPKMRELYSLGEVGGFIPDGKRLKTVRFTPLNGRVRMETVFEHDSIAVVGSTRERVVGIDLGVENFATLVTNFGESPILIKGGSLKAENQYYNKKRAEMTSKLTGEKKTSHAIGRLTDSRNNKMSDIMHRVSRWIVDWCVTHRVDCIIIGKNDGWKNGVKLGDKNTQNFVMIPFSQFIGMLRYKADTAGIEVVETEESYTSKASFLDGDSMPVYGVSDNEKHVFNGSRVSRGLYCASDGRVLNADVNGAANIVRKVIPSAFSTLGARGSSGVVGTPVVVRVVGSGEIIIGRRKTRDDGSREAIQRSTLVGA